MQDLSAFLAEQDAKRLVRFVTCGSVDDGKSTLLGRLLFEARALFDDQRATLEKDSKRWGTTGGDLDFALLTDGLEAEREQGITIDVAYRYFQTPRASFIVADCPGHEQYTRNMATGASTSDVAVLLVDARKGLLTQTRRHAHIVSLLGIRHVVLAVNKIDLVDFDRARFDAVVASFGAISGRLGFTSSVAIPLSARFGDNVSQRSARTPWYEGPALLEWLEGVEIEAAGPRPFRMPVQWVSRPAADFRGLSGTVTSGAIARGDALVVATSGRASTVQRIVTYDGELERAGTGDACTLVLADEIDVSIGDVLARPDARPEVSDQLAAHVLWMAEDELLPGRPYLLKSAARTVPAQVTALKHTVDVDTFARTAGKTLKLNEIGVVNVALGEPLAFDRYEESRETGSFILIDRFDNRTVAAGMIDFSLRRADNLHRQHFDVTAATRAAMMAQEPALVWFTGLSGSGKSTIANLVERELAARGRHTYLLDGDNVRAGLCRDLGFTDADRVENIRRVAEVGKLFVDAGLIVLASFISPFRAERRLARELFGAGRFGLVFVDTPLDVCIERDPKGLYAKAARGDLRNFTGLDSPYEAPDDAELVLSTVSRSAEELASDVVRWIERGRST